MIYHTIKFNTAKKDNDGFAKLLVKFGDWYIPMLGKPVPLNDEDAKFIMDECEEERNLVEEIKRLNLTRWILKDIPEVAALIGNLADGTASWLFYYNGSEDSWKFYDGHFAGIDEDGDDFDERIDKLDELIDMWDSELYRPHNEGVGNYGNETVHGVYTDDLKKVLKNYNEDDDHDQDPDEAVCDEYDLVEYIKNIPKKIDLARKQHKKLPYKEIGMEAWERLQCIVEGGFADEFADLGKFLYRLTKEL